MLLCLGVWATFQAVGGIGESGAAGSAPTTGATQVPSVCGLVSEGQPGGPIADASPAATWLYRGSGTTAYPSSPVHGPGVMDGGVRYCFARTTEGALFAAANALALPTEQVAVENWANHFIGEGPYRQEWLGQVSNPGRTDVRLRIVGFRVLDQSADTALVDLAVEMGTRTGGATLGSFVYDLVWEDGDWKANAATAQPLSFTVIPHTGGYTPWGP